MMACSGPGAMLSGWASPCGIGPSRSPPANNSELRFLQIISVSAVVIPSIRLERSPACNHSVRKADALPADQHVSSERINPARNRRRHFSAASSFSLASSASICASNRGSTTASGWTGGLNTARSSSGSCDRPLPASGAGAGSSKRVTGTRGLLPLAGILSVALPAQGPGMTMPPISGAVPACDHEWRFERRGHHAGVFRRKQGRAHSDSW
jgi:hypothetical protein